MNLDRFLCYFGRHSDLHVIDDDKVWVDFQACRFCGRVRNIFANFKLAVGESGNVMHWNSRSKITEILPESKS